MIIDCHGHFTTVPKSFRDWRQAQVDAANDPANAPPVSGAHVSDDEIREGVGNGQLKLQQERGSDITLFSPIAGLMSHHLGNERTSLQWAEVSNNLVKRVTEIYPDNFVPVCQLPQSPGAPPKPTRSPSCVAASRSWASSAPT
jgi:4-oxalmesaconate hydratase